MDKEPLRLAGVSGRKPVLQKLVYELRYRQGYTYLDRCGRILNLIQRDYPEWILQGEQVTPQNAPLYSLRNGSVFHFSSLSLSLSLEKPLGQEQPSKTDVEDYIKQADALTALVTDQLGVSTEQLTRIGFRIWYTFACRDQHDAEDWLLSLGCYTVSPGIAKAFGGDVDSVAVAVVVTGDDRSYRIGFNTGERQAQVDVGEAVLNVRARSLPKGQKEFLLDQLKKQSRIRQNPEFVAIIDLDGYQEDPKVLDVQDFLQTGWVGMWEHFQAAVGK